MERAWAVARNLISRYSLLWEMFLSSVFVSLIVTYLKVRDFFFLVCLLYFKPRLYFYNAFSSNSNKVIW